MKTLLVLFMMIALMLSLSGYGQEKSLKEVLTISARQARSLQLFVEYEKLREARLYQHSDSTYLLQLNWEEWRKRKPLKIFLTEQEGIEFQRQVTLRMGKRRLFSRKNYFLRSPFKTLTRN